MNQLIKFSDSSFVKRAIQYGVEQGILQPDDAARFETELVVVVQEVLESVGIKGSISDTLKDYREIFSSYLEVGLEYQAKGSIPAAARLLTTGSALQTAFRYGYSFLVALKKRAKAMEDQYQINPDYNLFPTLDSAELGLACKVLDSILISPECKLGEYVHNFQEALEVRDGLAKFKQPIELLVCLLGQAYREKITRVTKTPAWSEYVLQHDANNKALFDIWMCLGTIIGNILLHNQVVFALLEAKDAMHMVDKINHMTVDDCVNLAKQWFGATYPEHPELVEVFGAAVGMLHERARTQILSRTEETRAFCHRMELYDFSEMPALQSEAEGVLFAEEFELGDEARKAALLGQKTPDFLVDFMQTYTNAFKNRDRTQEFVHLMVNALVYSMSVQNFVAVLLLLGQKEGSEIADEICDKLPDTDKHFKKSTLIRKALEKS